MKKIVFYISVPIILIVLTIISLAVFKIVSIAISKDPLRKSEEQIREGILESIPIGTSMDDVITIIKSKDNWKHIYNGSWVPMSSIPDDYPIYIDRGYEKSGTFYEYVGIKSIHILIGEYSGKIDFDWNVINTIAFSFFDVSVSADLGFDENFKLIDIEVSKSWP